ncbi:MAG TPA: thioredoxin domain-containing protein [Longimicrobiales bacterium]
MSTRAFTTAILVIIAAGAAAMLAATFAVTREPSIRTMRIGQAIAERTRHAGVAVGPADAAVVVRIFSDFQCAACRWLDEEAGARLRHWAAEGRLRYVHIHAPLRAHRRGPAAARASYCAARDGKQWDMHRLLAERVAEWSQGEPPEPKFIVYAAALGLDTAGFARCLSDPAIAREVEEDALAARDLAPGHVPAIYVNDELILGLRRPEQLLDHVRARLAAPHDGAPSEPAVRKRIPPRPRMSGAR